jgi:hypothetical protein
MKRALKRSLLYRMLIYRVLKYTVVMNRMLIIYRVLVICRGHCIESSYTEC